jgi:hypothetical protein
MGSADADRARIAEEHLRGTVARLHELLDALPPLKPGAVDSNNRELLHVALKSAIEGLEKKVVGDYQAAMDLAFVVGTLRKFLPLERDWQTAHVKDFKLKPAQRKIIEEAQRLDAEGFAGSLIAEITERLEKEIHSADPRRYVADTLRKYKK